MEQERPSRRHPLAECEKCPLNNKDTVFVPSCGPEKAKYAAVGEAPGWQEANKGIPFIGPSGRLLTTVLSHHGINRNEVFLTNAALCRPPENATPSKEATAACRPRLQAELRDREPEYVFALGGSAAQTILGTNEGITKLRVGPGRVVSTFPRAVIIPTWHPAYCLRTADAFPDLVSDIGKFKITNRKKWTPPEYHVLDDEVGALFVIHQLMNEQYPKLVVDIEVGIEKDVSFEHPEQHTMLCIGIAYAKGKAVVIGEEACKSEKVADALIELFRNKILGGQNFKFDQKGLWAWFKRRFMPKANFDTMFADYTLDERPGRHSLEYLGVEIIGAPNWKNDIAKYVRKGESYAVVPRPILYKYNAYDVAVTWDLWEYFEERLDAAGLRPLHDFLVEASNELLYLELNGITFDMAYSDRLVHEYMEVLEAIEQRINDVVTVAKREIGTLDETSTALLNPRSPKQVKEFLHERGAKVASTDVDTLKRLQEKVRPESYLAMFISLLLEHRRKAKLYGTYVKGMRKRVHRGRIHTTYLLHNTTSGRLASRNPNLQNIVRDKAIKNQFVVSKVGNIFVQCDYKQAEGRVICWLAEDEYLRSKFLDPTIDIFNDLSDDLYGVGKWAKEERVRTKAFFYGIGYGRTPMSIALEYNMSVREAQKRYDEFCSLIPATVRWQQETKQRVLSGHDLVTPFGRHRRFWLITEENKKDVLNEALSFIPQSSASDICVKSLIRLRPMLRGKAFMRLTIHDALVAECAQERREEVGGLMRQVMIEEAARLTNYVPFEVDTSYGTRWGEL